MERDARTGNPLEREEKRLDQVLGAEAGLVVLPPPPDGTLMQHLILRGHVQCGDCQQMGTYGDTCRYDVKHEHRRDQLR